FVLSLLIIEVIALFLYSKSKNRTDENFSISPIYYRTEIILADEPVASLDPLTTKQVMDDLRKINQELGITILINLHFVDLAKEYGTRIIGLRDGEVVYDGPASEATDDVFSEIYGRTIKEDEKLGVN
ncbi:TPA: hypothetical protein ACN4SF_002040, partial [Staphylococcus aureus]